MGHSRIPQLISLLFQRKNRVQMIVNTLNTKVPQMDTLCLLLSENVSIFEQIFQNCSDILFRKFTVGTNLQAVMIWVDGLADKKELNGDIMKSLLHEARLLEPNDITQSDTTVQFIRNSLINVADIKELSKVSEIVHSVLTGESAVIIDGYPHALIISTKGWEKRSVSEPLTEGVVRGPREGFVENIRTNTSLIRRIIKTPDLKMEAFILGKLTKTDVVIAYVQGLADDKVVNEVRQRISRINVDSILESGYIEELIEDHPFSPFPKIAHTERPDKTAAQLLEGRVAILTDGTPFVLILPILFMQLLQSNEDYYERYFMGSAMRMIRFAFFLISFLFPSAYVAVTTYHQEMLPTSLLISIAAAHEGVPFPAFVEAVMMEITFEALREAGVRLPRPVGQAVSIVGALVIGEAAVKAGIVSPAMVIVVAVTAIASFTVPSFNLGITMRLLRFPMMVLAATLGFYGISLGLLVILIHLCSLRSFGVPYLAPVAPFHWQDMKDAILRLPWWSMNKRSQLFTNNNRQRQDVEKPDPPSTS